MNVILLEGTTENRMTAGALCAGPIVIDELDDLYRKLPLTEPRPKEAIIKF